MCIASINAHEDFLLEITVSLKMLGLSYTGARDNIYSQPQRVAASTESCIMGCL